MNRVRAFFQNLKKRINTFFLVMRFPFISTGDRSFTWLDVMPEGWRRAFGKELCASLKKILKKAHYVRKYKICDIKEKWGKLCIYDCGAPEKIYDELQECLRYYEDLSMLFCARCGNITSYITDGWISYICKRCKECSTYPASPLTWDHIPLDTKVDTCMFKNAWIQPEVKIFRRGKHVFIINQGSELYLSKVKIIKVNKQQDGTITYTVKRKNKDKEGQETFCQFCVYETEREAIKAMNEMLLPEQIIIGETIDETK